MQDPTGPWVVAWYENLGALGSIGNIVMAGHIDYWNVGPSVFYNLSTLQPGAEIVVTGEDGKAYPYAVEWVQQFDSTSMPLRPGATRHRLVLQTRASGGYAPHLNCNPGAPTRRIQGTTGDERGGRDLA